MRKIYLILFLLPFLTFGQTSTQFLSGYYNATTNYGFSCNVQVQITKQITGTKLVFKAKLLSVKMADNKGWYDNSMHKFYSCDLVGNYCVIFPQFISVKTEYGNLPFDSYSFNYVGEERVIYESTVAIFKSVVGEDASTFKIPAISQTIVSHNGDVINDKIMRIREGERTKSNTSSSNSNPVSSTNTSASGNPLTNRTTTTTSNIDPNTGLMTNPLPYSSTTGSNSKLVQNMQNATAIANGLVGLFTPSQQEIARREQESQQKSLLNTQGAQLIVEARNEFQQFIKTNPNPLSTANYGNSESRKILVEKYLSLYDKYSSLMNANGLNILKQEKTYYDLDDNLKNLLGGKQVLQKWGEEDLQLKEVSNNLEEKKKAADLYRYKYFESTGTEKLKNKDKMLSLYKAAADLGSIDAVIQLTDDGVVVDNLELSEVIKYNKQGMDAGCAICFYRHGRYYLEEEYKWKYRAEKLRKAGFEIDNKIAIDYFLKAIEADEKENKISDCNLKRYLYSIYKHLSLLYKEIGDRETSKKYKKLYEK